MLRWVVVAVAVMGGVAVGAAADPAVARAVVGLAISLAAVACASVVAKPGARWAPAGVMTMVLALAAVRGIASGPDHDTVAFGRGLPRGIVELEVVAAGLPGLRCRVRADEPASGRRLLLTGPPSLCPVAAGQRVRVRARDLRIEGAPAWPGGPDPAKVAQRAGADLSARVDRAWVVGTPSAYWGAVAALRQRAWVRSRSDPAAAFVAASALGLRDALPHPRRAQLRRAGLGHLIAVSGLHIALVALAVAMTLGRLGALAGLRPAIPAVVALLPVLAYVGLTGAAAPAVRAATMASVVTLGIAAGRPSHGPTIVAAVAAGMLLWRPGWAFDPGYQMSVVAMFALTTTRRGGLVAQTWRVSWAIAPVGLWHFGTVSMAGVVTNLIAVPVFAGWVLPLGLLGWLIPGPVGEAGITAAGWGAQLILDLAEFAAAWPSPPPWSIVAIAAAAIVGRWLVRRARGLFPPVIVCLALIGTSVVPPVPRTTGIYALGSARRPAIVAVSAGRACVVAPGGNPRRMHRMLVALGVRAVARIEAPPEAPHVVALREELLRGGRLDPGPIVCPEPANASRILRQCARQGAKVVRLSPRPACFIRGTWQRTRVAIVPAP